MGMKKSVASPAPRKKAKPKVKAQPSPTVEGLIGLRIKEARIARGISQHRLAHGIPMDRAHLGQLENGHHGASPVILAKIAVALGCQMAELFPDVAELAEIVDVRAIEHGPRLAGGR